MLEPKQTACSKNQPGKMNILEALRGEVDKLEQQLNSINGAIAVLGGGNPNAGNGRKHRNGRRKKFSAAELQAPEREGRIKWKENTCTV